jgi:hypothetical protein
MAQCRSSWPFGTGGVFPPSCGVSCLREGGSHTTALTETVVFAIYIDSYIFVFATALLQNAIGVNTNLRTCDGAILICLICYVTTKVRWA